MKFDLLLCSGDYDKKIFEHIFPNNINVDVVGLPRNEALVKESLNKDIIKNRVIKKLGLDPQKEVLLYAPTFREYNLGISSGENKFFDKKFLDKISKEYNVLVRGHYFALENLNNKHIFNVSKYENLNELMIASDILISDYSSIIFDYLLLDKPILLYLFDYTKYSTYRGLYFNPNNFFDSYIEINQLTEKLLRKDFKNSKNLKRQFNNLNNPLSLIKNKLLDSK
ncbi:CDP-glycerol glycerophosphotransferase family protein [Pediococcus pentosaceus]|uniref:CDP-glycerol glycerophosphotransferase family protein n=1 Tax=Pediococcus pentosaceus TaxID=1255 RepID=UPI002FBECAFC